ncbi:hypothetical protein ROJ8625_03628 [Roseivivax jejudonensis]|uniref:Histidine phosphatase superfamily (Branch 1) n=1 Tax=Roseivivax jejudonensis TaxID=1529041 RepID=A0A1X7A3U3_9RHOB|nr:histidine phosphatase family protein [Roseivivax jejudonensis]SLN69697.1 hypothetical protein ROJ8625_03628 [Roseivivax jejudonensis]
MRLRRRDILAAGLALPALSLPARANDWDAFGEEGAVAPGTGDPPGFEIGDCATQRTLSEAGRAQARTIGAALRARGIGFDRVLTSAWCRCRETADLLGVGPVETAPAFNSFFSDRAARAARTEAALGIVSRARGRVLAVTHQVNISALTGQGTASGEIVIARPTEGGMTVLGSVFLAA